MGIVNCTPDSFSHDGCLGKGGAPAAVRYAKKLIREGADIIDIGGESSRPGARQISAAEEIKRVVPVIQALAKTHSTIPISVDTYKTDVTKAALDAGAQIVNNIKGAQPDKKLLQVVRDYKAAVVLMHMKGTPQTMQKNPRYRQIIGEITANLRKSIEICLEIGIKSDRIIIDPGIGFGKTVAHNLNIINNLQDFHVLGCPLLIGTSRKSFIGKILDNDDVKDRLIGSIVTAGTCVLKGAHIIRAHDVKKTKEAVSVLDAILKS